MNEREHCNAIGAPGRNQIALASFVGGMAKAEPGINDNCARPRCADDWNGAAIHLAAGDVVAVSREVAEPNCTNAFRLGIADAARGGICLPR